VDAFSTECTLSDGAGFAAFQTQGCPKKRRNREIGFAAAATVRVGVVRVPPLVPGRKDE
jgi:hypothetical protein